MLKKYWQQLKNIDNGQENIAVVSIEVWGLNQKVGNKNRSPVAAIEDQTRNNGLEMGIES